MKEVFSNLRKHFIRMRIAYLVLALSLVPTGFIYYRVKTNVEGRNQARFDRIVQEQQAVIEQRMPRYVDEMLAVRGLFAASSSVTADEWQKYVSHLQIEQHYPGIRGIGYLEQVGRDRLTGFLQRMRAREGQGFRVLPEGDRPLYYSTVYASRFDSSLQTGLGQDDFASPDRREALANARDSGQPTATGKIAMLDQSPDNQSRPGFVIYLPVYRNGATTATVDERRAALQGFICSAFEPAKLMASIFGKQSNSVVGFSVYEGAPTWEHLLYGHYPEGQNVPGGDPHFTRVITLPILDRTWSMRFTTLPSFEAESQAYLPILAFGCSLGLSFLLFGITCVQVNARARAEKISAELRQSEAALAAETERLAVTLYSIGDGVITTDTTGRVLSINKVGEQLTGWLQVETLGKTLAEFFNVIQEKTRERCPNPVEDVLRTGVIAAPSQASILIARDGTERAIADSAAPIRDKTGGIIGVVLVFRDITEKQKSEAELLKESKLESVGLLAGGIAHDFNNILLGILGNLSLARMNAHSSEKMLERLLGVEKAAMRAKELTQQLVMFARGGAPIRKQVQLAHIVKDATLFTLHGASVHCEFSLPAELWSVEVDEGQFRQVIHNLVLNAVQAMSEGGRIEVRAENVEFDAGFLPPLAAGKYVKISVRDFGTGIAPEHISRIFDPYFSTRKHARGLGLASAYSVIRKHDGQINVESYVARGTTFRIYLPASFKPEIAPAHDTDQRRFFGQGRVLVMDDEVDILTLVREMLQMMGYEVETARDGAEALQRYQAAKQSDQAFAAVIMDLTVPEGMGGKEAIRRLKELDPQVRAIVSSGYSYDPVMANFQEYGFSGVIPKPYVMEDLARVLSEVITKKQQPILETA
ncbi:MAG: multi-sensor hybrid histidine kinase [Pedosphaera sp.]|nr:multi-sensor hybrid histidine kinase [Pedosphaera sp.]